MANIKNKPSNALKEALAKKQANEASNKFKSESASVSSSKGLSGAGKGKGQKIKFT